MGRGGHTLPTYRALLNRLSRSFELTVYSEVPVEKEWLELEHMYTIKGVPRARLPRRLRELLFILLLIKDHLRKPFHLVHAHSTYPTGFAGVLCQKIFGLPVIVSLHAAEGSALPDIGFGDLLHRRRAKVNRWVINHARVVTALSDFQRREVVRHLGVRRPVVVIHRGVDLEKFYFERPEPIGSPIVFLAVGYLNPIKDPETLLNAFCAIRKELDSVLILVGRDYTEGAVRTQVDALGLSASVKLEGHIDHDMLVAYYRKADFLLHTSRYESQGMVVAEAMASGVLVAGTRVGLMSDLSETCCLTVPPRDAKGLAQAVLRLLRDPAKMRELRTNAYRWSKAHSLERCADTIADLYREQMLAQ